MKALQLFSPEYLEQCKKMKPKQILEFLEDFRKLHSVDRFKKDRSILISMKVPESVLRAFKVAADLKGVKYQTQIKVLMKDWLRKQQ